MQGGREEREAEGGKEEQRERSCSVGTGVLSEKGGEARCLEPPFGLPMRIVWRLTG